MSLTPIQGSTVSQFFRTQGQQNGWRWWCSSARAFLELLRVPQDLLWVPQGSSGLLRVPQDLLWAPRDFLKPPQGSSGLLVSRVPVVPPPEPQRGLLLLCEAAGAQQLGQQGLHLHLQLQDPRQHIHLRARRPSLGGAWPGRAGLRPPEPPPLISSPPGAHLWSESSQ